MNKTCPQRICYKSLVVTHCLHDTVRYPIIDSLLSIMNSRSFIIPLNAIVSGSIEEADLHRNWEMDFIQKKIMYGGISTELFITHC